MKCNVCGENYSSPSLGGPGICPRCDCGLDRKGNKLSLEETSVIANRYRLGIKPYLPPPTSIEPLGGLERPSDEK